PAASDLEGQRSSQLSYTRKNREPIPSGRGDLNPRPPAPKAGALPLRHSPVCQKGTGANQGRKRLRATAHPPACWSCWTNSVKFRAPFVNRHVSVPGTVLAWQLISVGGGDGNGRLSRSSAAVCVLKRPRAAASSCRHAATAASATAAGVDTADGDAGALGGPGSALPGLPKGSGMVHAPRVMARPASAAARAAPAGKAGVLPFAPAALPPRTPSIHPAGRRLT